MAVHLSALHDDEGAAVLIGAADAIMVSNLLEHIEARTRLIANLEERLGAQRIAELRASGAALADDDAVAYANKRVTLLEGDSAH